MKDVVTLTPVHPGWMSWHSNLQNEPTVTSGKSGHRTRNCLGRSSCSTDEVLELQLQEDELWKQSPAGAPAREGRVAWLSASSSGAVARYQVTEGCLGIGDEVRKGGVLGSKGEVRFAEGAVASEAAGEAATDYQTFKFQPSENTALAAPPYSGTTRDASLDDENMPLSQKQTYTLFFVVVAKRAQLVILALSGAFVWLVAILVTATLWQIIPPLKTSLSATVPAVKRVTTSSHQLPLNDITSSLAGGVGFSVMHALLMFGSLVGSSTGSRGAAFSSSCESIPLIFSAAISTLALTALDVALMVVAFDGYRKRSVLAVGAVFVIHMGVALSALANMETNGCYISIPVHYAGAALACAGATTIVWRSKRLAVDAK
ncbi:hypothetical protein PC111_g18566 [Phytophthora cactorum]|nr:hypothetical protein PC112_g19408 [Phytophthora cactorum]KAG2803727.1 hypothetical protein PC111_g18566 [Phytophthora cactorum]